MKLGSDFMSQEKKYQGILEWRQPVCYSIFLELKKQKPFPDDWKVILTR
jgi:hypothetical protein